MAHKKAGGSSRNGRDSESKRLGVKKFGGEEMREKVADGTARGEGLADQLPGEEKISDSGA